MTNRFRQTAAVIYAKMLRVADSSLNISSLVLKLSDSGSLHM